MQLKMVTWSVLNTVLKDGTNLKNFGISISIDIDDPVWRRLFTIDLSKHPELKVKVENKKKEIEDMKQVSKASLENKLPLDIIKFILQPYF
jgi:imidazoleglycerol phosphate dehydratase HisB